MPMGQVRRYQLRLGAGAGVDCTRLAGRAGDHADHSGVEPGAGALLGMGLQRFPPMTAPEKDNAPHRLASNVKYLAQLDKTSYV